VILAAEYLGKLMPVELKQPNNWAGAGLITGNDQPLLDPRIIKREICILSPVEGQVVTRHHAFNMNFYGRTLPS